MKAIAVTNQKGGVAKTTTALNLAVALTRAGHRVLVVDLDPQANLTTQSGFDIRQKRLSIYDVLVNKTPMADVIERGSLGFWVAPSDEILMRAEMEMGDKNLGGFASFVRRSSRSGSGSTIASSTRRLCAASSPSTRSLPPTTA